MDFTDQWTNKERTQYYCGEEHRKT